MQTHFVFFPMVFTFSQLRDLYKISPNPFPNVLNRINLPASWFCLHPYQILPKALCLILSAAKHLCLVLCGQYKCEQPLVLLCLGRNCCPKMLHAGLHCWASLLTVFAQVVKEGKAEGRKTGISNEASEMQHRVVWKK